MKSEESHYLLIQDLTCKALLLMVFNPACSEYLPCFFINSNDSRLESSPDVTINHVEEVRQFCC